MSFKEVCFEFERNIVVQKILIFVKFIHDE